MKVLLCYATNSGSTYLVGQRICQGLVDYDIQCISKEIHQVSPEHFQEYDLIIFGSPSWDYREKEGQPHLAFFNFFEQYPDVSFSNKKLALFGLGDRSYIYFCGAMDVLKAWIEQRQGVVIGEPLRINRFYFNDPEVSFSQATAWVHTLMESLGVVQHTTT